MTNFQKNLPLYLTLSRVLAVPFIILSLIGSSQWGGIVAAVFFIAASITDYYDGYFARKYQIESVTGKLLDPVSDKVLVTSTLILLIPMHRLDPYMVILLLARDSLINGIRSIAATKGVVIAAVSLGKWKTGLQMVGIPCVLVHTLPIPYLDQLPVYNIGYGIMWISVVLSLLSGYTYVRDYIRTQSHT